MRVIAFNAYPAIEKARVAAVQVINTPAFTKNDQIRNAERHLALIQPFYGRVDLVCFPELSTAGFLTTKRPPTLPPHDYLPLAETVDGPICSLFREAARQLGSWIGFGLPRKDGKHVYNSQVFAGPNGEIKYCDKLDERLFSFALGAKTLSLMINGIKISVVLCRNMFTEQTDKRIESEKPHLVLLPAYTSSTDRFARYATKWGSHLLTVNFVEREDTTANQPFGSGCSTAYVNRAGAITQLSLNATEEGAVFILL